MLTDLPVPDLSQAQLSQFTREALLEKSVGKISVQQIRDALIAAEDANVWAVDIGGTALKAAPGRVQGGTVVFDEDAWLTVGIERDGENYLETLRSLVPRAEGMRVGISTAGVVLPDGTIDNPNTAAFAQALKAAGGFPALFDGSYRVVNDAIAGLVAGMYGVYRNGDTFSSALSVINGGGIGGAVMTAGGEVFATEPGQIPLTDGLNPYHVPGRKNVNGRTYPCIEQVGAMRHGVEPQWQQETGTALTAEAIAGRMPEGDGQAIELIDRAALVTAHAIAGMQQAFDLPWAETAIILHGGAFRTEAFADRISQILERHAGRGNAVRMYSAYGLGYADACLSGAAMMTFVRQ